MKFKVDKLTLVVILLFVLFFLFLTGFLFMAPLPNKPPSEWEWYHMDPLGRPPT